MRAALILALLAGCGCCHPIPPPVPPQPAQHDMAPGPTPENIYGFPNCPSSASATFADVCDGMFTKAGLSCAICHGGAACYDSSDGIYCAGGKAGCLDDSACIFVQDGTAGGPNAQAKRPKHAKGKQ